jgi:hypothetical protein
VGTSPKAPPSADTLFRLHPAIEAPVTIAPVPAIFKKSLRLRSFSFTIATKSLYRVMSVMAFYKYRAKGPCGAVMFARAATCAFFVVDGGYF